MNTARSWVGWAALTVGVGAVVSSLASTSTRVGGGLTLGFGAFIAFFALLSLLARNRTPNYWGIFLAGFVMFLLPWLASGFAPDPGAAWTAWVAGFLAMTLGAVGWLTSAPPTQTGINEYGAAATQRISLAVWIGATALILGILTALLGATMVNSPGAVAAMVGLGGLTTVIAVWSLLAIDPTRDYLTLAIAGFALFLAPWVAGFAGEGAAWAIWFSGGIATALGVTGYLRSESLDLATAVRDQAEARYRESYR